MIKLFRLWCLSALLCLMPSAINAIEMSGLYKGRVEVAGQTFQDRKAAYKTALQQVIVRVSGDVKVLSKPQIKTLLAEPTRFLSQYSFVTEAETLWLEASFNPEMINQALSDQNINIWGSRRPESLWWMVVESPEQRKIVAHDDPDIAPRILKRANYRGLPVVLPLMDLDDQFAIEMTDIRGRFVSAVENASQRYQPEALVLARVFQQSIANSDSLSRVWIGQVTLSIQGQTFETTISRGQQADIWPLLIDWVSDQIAQQYSVNSTYTGSDHIVITLENLASAAEVVRVQAFFKTLSAVEQVQVIQLDSRGIAFSIALKTPKDNFLRALSLDSQVQKVIHPIGYEGPEVDYLYRWKGQFN